MLIVECIVTSFRLKNNKNRKKNQKIAKYYPLLTKILTHERNDDIFGTVLKFLNFIIMRTVTYYLGGYEVTIVVGNNLLKFDASAFVAERFSDRFEAVEQTSYLRHSPFAEGVLDYEDELDQNGGELPYGHACVSKTIYGKRIINSTILGVDKELPLKEREFLVRHAWANIVVCANAQKIKDVVVPALATSDKYGCLSHAESAKCLVAVLLKLQSKEAPSLAMTVVVPDEEGAKEFERIFNRQHKIEPADDL